MVSEASDLGVSIVDDGSREGFERNALELISKLRLEVRRVSEKYMIRLNDQNKGRWETAGLGGRCEREGNKVWSWLKIFHAQNMKPELWCPTFVACWNLGVFKHSGCQMSIHSHT